MLDLNLIRNHPEEVAENLKKRRVSFDLPAFLALDRQKRELLARAEELRSRRNENTKKLKRPLPDEERQELFREGKVLKDRIAETEEQEKKIDLELQARAENLPNMTHPEVPEGEDESAFREIRREGEIPSFSFPVRDHVNLLENLDLIDFERGRKVSGSKFYFLKNEAVLLETALIRFALDRLREEGFTLLTPPDLARESICRGTGFKPKGEESNIYTVEDSDLALIGTAEIPLGGYYAGEILDFSDGPILLAGISHCFRKEAGAAGRYSRGLYRVHQFSKVEMFAFTEPDDSEAIHLKLREIEEGIFRDLEIPFRVMDICSGDLGASAYRKFDLEAWMPGRGESGDWGEVTSTSDCRDYQARRLKIRYKDKNKKNRFVHTLNGTAVAVSRAIVALAENGQQADGSIKLPSVLFPYTGFQSLSPRG